MTQSRTFTAILAGLGLLALAGCDAHTAANTTPPPPEVGVMTVQAEDVALRVELPGRTSAYLVADVRPQVSGIIRERLFTEGADVAAGAPLYQIDDDTYKAEVASAEAALAKAEAALTTARLKAKRYRELVQARAVSQQEADEAIALERQAEAEVAERRAALQSARIDLRRTRITATIAGRIGKSTVTPGALVTADQAQALATVQQLDQVYVDITRSSLELLKLQDELASGRLQSAGNNTARVTLQLEDGSLYPHPGTLAFSDVTIDTTTASVTLRAVFPNPELRLLPGMYVRALLQEGVRTGGILVPQQAVQRDAQGKASVMVVDARNVATLRPITTQRAVDNQWLVDSGLQPGERIILEGLQKVRPDAPVTPVVRDDAKASTPAGAH